MGMPRIFVIFLTFGTLACSTPETTPGAPDAAGDGTVLDDALTGDDAVTADAGFAPCPDCCDPIYQTCDAGQACYNVTAFDNPPQPPTTAPMQCLVEGSGTVDGNCATNADCPKGSTCFGGSVMTCRKFCLDDCDCPTFQGTQERCIKGNSMPDGYGMCFHENGPGSCSQ